MPAYANLRRWWYSMYWVETDPDNRCSLYAVYDRGEFGSWSLVFCNTCSYKKASKSIRLSLGLPCAIIPNVKCLAKIPFWRIDADGYGEVLMALLKRPNSVFPFKTNWERIWKIMYKHGFHNYLTWNQIVPDEIPDYAHLWGTADWSYGDTDPDGTFFIEINRDHNMSIYGSAVHCNVLEPDEEEESGFLVFNDAERYRAKKVAKISVFEPVYLFHHPNSYACEKQEWRLNEAEKKVMIKLLKMRHRNDKRKTNWQYLLDILKMEGVITLNKSTGRFEENENFQTDLAMPDYMLLPD